MLKTIILPRQARDKHRENSKKVRFSQGVVKPVRKPAVSFLPILARACLGNLHQETCCFSIAGYYMPSPWYWQSCPAVSGGAEQSIGVGGVISLLATASYLASFQVLD